MTRALKSFALICAGAVLLTIAVALAATKEPRK